MIVDPDGPFPGRDTEPPREGSTDDDLVLGWVSSDDHRAATLDEGGCATCGFAGDLLDGPESSVCPACLAEYPKATAWKTLIRCPSCNLAIGISEESVGKSIVCSRCKCFIGGVSKTETGTTSESPLGWIKQVPVWVWLILGIWQLNKVVGTLELPPDLTRRLPYVGVFGFLGLASCRVWLWRNTGRKRGKPTAPMTGGS